MLEKIIRTLLIAGTLAASRPAYGNPTIRPNYQLRLQENPENDERPPNSPPNEEDQGAYYIDPEKRSSHPAPSLIKPTSYTSEPSTLPPPPKTASESSGSGWYILSGLAMIVAGYIVSQGEACVNDGTGERCAVPGPARYSGYSAMIIGGLLVTAGIYDISK